MSVPLSLSKFKIVHFYVDKALNWAHCQQTFQIVEVLKSKYNIESRCLDGNDDYAYWKALTELWGLGNLVTIEQDIVFTEDQLLEMLKCKHKDCAFAFKLYPLTTALAQPVWSVAESLLNQMPSRIRLYTLEEKPEFCNYTALGFTKLSKEAQLRLGPLEALGSPVHWKFVDLWTIGRIPEAKFHVHYEVEHAHR